MPTRFDLFKSVNENFERYQDGLKKNPDQWKELKNHYDHFLKSHMLHVKAEERAFKASQRVGQCQVMKFELEQEGEQEPALKQE
uniref:Uncharacterized protein n=1 Tax=Candidatus Kentrum sp. SD TaxID=2126332 RepID=A0A450YDT2_9GAMM|nr:MAG: hypothetical protein BECKSD772F_GA0070984_104624 [Candidatus Kentron sp. SD]VFK45309.1 MAG: hypothetical protein BECKSD772F_GA0070984_12185 [Candidatus Kentron sp. SD]VFK45612.1 MAG: hypothetical protein BECKSD772F_GA0070984_12391 [Candidatus Kentron sp. SD]VFK81067.1 MAG: hypothetical protein BECKSD772D_GA0070982_12124 [Candidatus Kentron sp. SD]